MIELFTADTPNGKKISIMLEEIKYDYKVTKINILKDEQFKPEFKKISPFSKIPVIKDHKNNITIFESGAILIYLGEQSGQLYDQDKKTTINQWLIGQVAYIGPMLGQHHQFHHYNIGKSKFGEDRYFKICTRIYKELDERLSETDYLAGNFYSIADVATFPWIARHDWHDIGLKKYKNLSRWYELISKREAVQKGYDLLEKGEKIPSI
jgi:GST-like protein